ncbi:RNA polymerase sigma factor [Sphingobium yanoikuyae]|nr:sigma-70 region 4 domain-containing protein [Sphingobium yanoikuyae]
MPGRRPEGAMAERFQIGLATLSPIPRIVFYLHSRDDFTFPEIAYRLGCSVLAVEDHFAEALAHLDAAVNRDG